MQYEAFKFSFFRRNGNDLNYVLLSQTSAALDSECFASFLHIFNSYISGKADLV